MIEDLFNEEPRYSIERHGRGWALYFGRNRARHGLRLCNLDDFDNKGEAVRKAIVDSLNEQLPGKLP